MYNIKNQNNCAYDITDRAKKQEVFYNGYKKTGGI